MRYLRIMRARVALASTALIVTCPWITAYAYPIEVGPGQTQPGPNIQIPQDNELRSTRSTVTVVSPKAAEWAGGMSDAHPSVPESVLPANTVVPSVTKPPGALTLTYHGTHDLANTPLGMTVTPEVLQPGTQPNHSAVFPVHVSNGNTEILDGYSSSETTLTPIGISDLDKALTVCYHHTATITFPPDESKVPSGTIAVKFEPAWSQSCTKLGAIRDDILLQRDTAQVKANKLIEQKEHTFVDTLVKRYGDSTQGGSISAVGSAP